MTVTIGIRSRSMLLARATLWVAKRLEWLLPERKRVGLYNAILRMFRVEFRIGSGKWWLLTVGDDAEK